MAIYTVFKLHKMLTHVIAPAPSSEWNVFEKNVFNKNSDGTPLEGSIVVNFSVTSDIRTLPEEDLHRSIFNACNEEGKTMYKIKQLKDIYELLQPGNIVALKKGKSLYAWAEITKSYYYIPCPKWGHHWDYKILRMANINESERHDGWMKTFHMNAIEIPADVLKIQTLNRSRQTIRELNYKMTILHANMQEAIEAYQIAENEFNSLERALELSEVM